MASKCALDAEDTVVPVLCVQIKLIPEANTGSTSTYCSRWSFSIKVLEWHC